ncbi:GntR family transcriptional regulator [Lentibacillus cibarius]|uniref:GntR family transcriptional regulator n=1 Tax=Lentibacillus cibarius TaxID=2583219 RepID=A0A549YM50_9BACI|nr:GntR family transcriptional regulator [Lentibacillus cibarius]TMN21173.1 GntR family transcriptional regulator [Lentibacillus cibarius]TRM12953.1 GntR family transcriptional regulator [Lentibacillus cibarius]
MVEMEGSKPIYTQIAEWLENQILNGHFQPHDKVHSQYTLADMFNINPATAAKGLNMLYDEQVLYNKRGLGKFVTDDAVSTIREKRKNDTLTRMLRDVVTEATHLRIDDEELMDMLKHMIDEQRGEKA